MLSDSYAREGPGDRRGLKPGVTLDRTLDLDLALGTRARLCAGVHRRGCAGCALRAHLHARVARGYMGSSSRTGRACFRSIDRCFFAGVHDHDILSDSCICVFQDGIACRHSHVFASDGYREPAVRVQFPQASAQPTSRRSPLSRPWPCYLLRGVCGGD